MSLQRDDLSLRLAARDLSLRAAAACRSARERAGTGLPAIVLDGDMRPAWQIEAE